MDRVSRARGQAYEGGVRAKAAGDPGILSYAKASPAESETYAHGEADSTVAAEPVTWTALPHPRSPRRSAARLKSLLVGRTVGDLVTVAAVLGRGGMADCTGRVTSELGRMRPWDGPRAGRVS